MKISIAESLLQSTQTLSEAGVPEPRKEATSLLADVLQKDRTFLISHPESQLTNEEIINFQNFISRRAKGEPLQYITGFQDFYGRVFKVTPDVLIPRPETELLVEEAIRLLNKSKGEENVCDVGTGSGCIVVTLVAALKNVRATAVDVSMQALEVAKLNAVTYDVDHRILFQISDCFESLKPGSTFDLVVSNPPYVSARELEGLQREVKDHEPLVALSPGTDGLAVIRRLLNDAPAFLLEQGHLLFEIGFDQGEAVTSLIDPKIWHVRQILPDLQGIPRIVSLQKIRS